VSVAGGCLCGAVRYRIDGPLRDVVACHCGQCRRTSGHHVAATSAAWRDVAITGEPRWFASSPEARRGFCPACGSNLFWERPGSGRLSIFAGTLDTPTGLRLGGHIFVADKGDYYDIADGLPQAAGADPGLTRPPS
jgi:hypothetical protein